MPTSLLDGEHILGRQGNRLEQLFEAVCDRSRADGRESVLAVDADETRLSYSELDARANRLARHLLEAGAGPGDRIALLFDHAVPAYVAMLAVLKIHAAYVPLDPGFPSDRMAYIIEDADVSRVLSLASLEAIMPEVSAPVLCIDREQEEIDHRDSRRVQLEVSAVGQDDLAYIIYTSGSTGRPKGVAIEHASICNFVRVAADVYGIRSQHRVYQGMTIAFDFSVEEIWVPWMAGATLVPKPRGTALLGAELAEFLTEKQVTAMCCVPTLLSTIEEDLPELSFLLVSGEACPRDLIVRWHRPGRRFLNVYGPTEATVTATMAVAHPDRAVTLGEPLPSYSAVILDPQRGRVLPHGELGEIGLAGIGLARGYVNRDDLTAKAFIPDFLGIPDNPSGRIYRTGDLGRLNEDGEIEYHGRIDTQVKVRGYRIELSEIESVLLRLPGIVQAVVNTYEPEPGCVELVGYYTVRQGTQEVPAQAIREHLRERLPGYMVPAYFERLDRMPRLPSDKVDRKKLPAPGGPRTSSSDDEYVAPSSETEQILADALTAVLRVEKVSAAAHFFDDLGANSMLMAQFCGCLRKDERVPNVAMRDIYLNPTVSALAVVVEDARATGSSPVVAPVGVSELPAPVSALRYAVCGAVQALYFLLSMFGASFLLVEGYLFASSGEGVLGVLWHSFLFGFVLLLIMILLPVVAKWLLIGRWKTQEFPVWSARYLRFWVVKSLIRANPMRMFIGTPVYPFYLRALGAKVGKRTVILSGFVPVCTDLLTIGDDTVIRKDTLFNCYRAHRGMIQTGTVTIGHNVLVGEASVLDIGTYIGDDAQLGHVSALHTHQSVPRGQHWHGSPAEPTGTDYRAADPVDCSTLRRVVYSVFTVINRVFFVSVIGLGLLAILLPAYLSTDHLDHTDSAFYLHLVVVSFVLFFGGTATGLVAVAIVPRVLNLFLKPNRVYPLYGVHYVLQRAVARLTNLRFYMWAAGDSSLIVHYLRLLGYKQPELVQTGSNFGSDQKHENPFLVTIGSGTLVADGLSVMNNEYSSSSFKVAPATVGSTCYFGNDIHYPSGSRIGDNCLLGTKAMVPVDGPIREGVGLLGSPSFEIPRSVRRDIEVRDRVTGAALRAGLRAKNKHNAVTLVLYLLSRWFFIVVTMLIASYAVALHSRYGVLVVTAAFLALFLFALGFSVLIERASFRFRRLDPVFCSIYDQRFWRHERYWKFLIQGIMAVFNGTPFKPGVWRLLGVRMGKRVFDDGCFIIEKTIVSVGDECTLNARAIIQCHSMEDRAFKLDGITIGKGCTVGVKAFIHYGVTIGDGAFVEADSFLMKGEEVPAQTTFGGNPARELPTRRIEFPAASGRHADPSKRRRPSGRLRRAGHGRHASRVHGGASTPPSGSRR
ncbi:amino acid adenylation domain-containing protein [Kocuria sp. CPCC 205292]|uniref:Pls/PosA family non-ribosomal peptide synthetase n=1 Tax=Kocuria cellulosilytica TaxID=3071451 RepID=UPI0034D5E79B